MDPISQSLYSTVPTGRISEPRAEPGEYVRAPDGRMRLQLERPNRETVVLTVSGEVDRVTAPRVQEMLRQRLRSELELVVLDLSGLDFLGIVGIHVLIQAHLRAEQLGTGLVIVTGGNRPVDRALTVTAGHHQLRQHPGPVAMLLSADSEVEQSG